VSRNRKEVHKLWRKFESKLTTAATIEQPEAEQIATEANVLAREAAVAGFGFFWRQVLSARWSICVFICVWYWSRKPGTIAEVLRSIPFTILVDVVVDVVVAMAKSRAIGLGQRCRFVCAFAGAPRQAKCERCTETSAPRPAKCERCTLSETRVGVALALKLSGQVGRATATRIRWQSRRF
jgi:hypothetical protein